jgi:hypothetical protein
MMDGLWASCIGAGEATGVTMADGALLYSVGPASCCCCEQADAGLE